MIGVMEDPMDENKDDNLGSLVEIERKKNKIKMRKPRGDPDFWFKKQEGNVNK